jgi:hypothetical protein
VRVDFAGCLLEATPLTDGVAVAVLDDNVAAAAPPDTGFDGDGAGDAMTGVEIALGVLGTLRTPAARSGVYWGYTPKPGVVVVPGVVGNAAGTLVPKAGVVVAPGVDGEAARTLGTPAWSGVYRG